MIRCSGEPELLNACLSDQDYVQRGVESELLWLLVFVAGGTLWAGCKTLVFWPENEVGGPLLLKHRFLFVVSALIKACWPMRTVFILVAIVSTDGCKVFKGFRWKKWTCQCSMRVLKADFAVMAGKQRNSQTQEKHFSLKECRWGGVYSHHRGDFDVEKNDFWRVLRVGEDDDSASITFDDGLFQFWWAKGLDGAAWLPDDDGFTKLFGIAGSNCALKTLSVVSVCGCVAQNSRKLRHSEETTLSVKMWINVASP